MEREGKARRGLLEGKSGRIGNWIERRTKRVYFGEGKGSRLVEGIITKIK